MAMQSEGKNVKGRSYDQATKGGSSSAASQGAGGTGDIKRQLKESQSGGSRQQARTDDLLSPDADGDSGQGYTPGEEAGELQTGLGGIGSLSTGNAGNRQSRDK
jgi:hypothetical protein